MPGGGGISSIYKSYLSTAHDACVVFARILLLSQFQTVRAAAGTELTGKFLRHQLLKAPAIHLEMVELGRSPREERIRFVKQKIGHCLPEYIVLILRDKQAVAVPAHPEGDAVSLCPAIRDLCLYQTRAGNDGLEKQFQVPDAKGLLFDFPHAPFFKTRYSGIIRSFSIRNVRAVGWFSSMS